jgi:DHA1 family tetracycline resistance protein-like MFS transporter
MLRNRRAGLAFIFVTILIDVLGFGIVIPVLPKLVASMAGPDPQKGDQVYGLFLAVFGLMQFLCAPVLGNLSDKYGRRSVLLVSLAFGGLDYILQATAPNLNWLFFGRVVAGITAANFTAATSYIADISAAEDRAKNFGLIGAAFGAGFIVGPAIGGLIGQLGPRVPFWAAAILTGVNWLYGFFVLPESLDEEHRRPFDWKRGNPIGSLKLLGREAWILALGVAITFLALGQQAPPSVWVLYTTQRFHWSERDNGISLAFIGFFSIAVQGGLIRVLSPRLGEWGLFAFGIVFNVIGFFALGLASRGWMMYPAMAVWSLGFVSGSAVQSLVSKAYGPTEQGAVQGALTSIQSLTGVIGPILMTGTFAFFTTAGHVIFGAPFYLGALLAALAGASAVYAARKNQ